MATETYATLITNLRVRIDEVGVSGFWTDAELLRYLVEGARDVTRKAECNRATANVSFTAGTFEMTGPTDAVRLHRCEWNTTGDTRRIPLSYQDFDNLDAVWYTQQATGQGEPRWWTTWGMPPTLTLKVYPVPSLAGTVKVYYYQLAPITTTAADNVPLPGGWEDVLLDHACYKAMMKDRDSRWQQYKQLYDENLASLVDTSAKFADTVGMIASPGGIGVPAWLYDPNYMG